MLIIQNYFCNSNKNFKGSSGVIFLNFRVMTHDHKRLRTTVLHQEVVLNLT